MPAEPPISAPVFLDLSQDELDRAYDQEVWAANGVEIQARIVARSAEIARRMPPVSRRYGPANKQFVDIFAAEGAEAAPVIVMIHGGAWRLAMREAFYGPAPSVVAACCVFAVVGFDCLPQISMPAMARQIQEALVWIAREIGAFGGDGTNLHLVGHSSGAHLAAVMMTEDWGSHDLAPSSLRSATLLSGIYDLLPPMLSARGRFMKLTPDEVHRLSPIRHLDRFTGSAIVAWGSAESPEFKRQSQAFADTLATAGKLDRALMLPGVNHYEMLEALNDADGAVMTAIKAIALDGGGSGGSIKPDPG